MDKLYIDICYCIYHLLLQTTMSSVFYCTPSLLLLWLNVSHFYVRNEITQKSPILTFSKFISHKLIHHQVSGLLFFLKVEKN